MSEQKKRILVVDDEKVCIEIIRSTLGTDYNISATTEGAEAEEIAQELQPDLILLDIIMPAASGYDVMSKLKKNEKTKDIPVIFLTAMTSVRDEEKGFNLGAADYIFKPFSGDLLLKRVEMNFKAIEYDKLMAEKNKD